MKPLFPSLPDGASLWVWAADRQLDDHESGEVLKRLQTFLRSWTSHGRAVIGDAAFTDQRILLIAGDVEAGDISGCGIDKSVHAIESAASELGFKWVTGLDVVYRPSETADIETASRAEFRRLAEAGDLGEGTVIYDRSPTTLGSLRSHGITTAATKTWTARYFRDAEANVRNS